MAMVAILVTWPGSFEQTPIVSPYEMWLWLAQQFLRCSKSVEDGRLAEHDERTTDPAYTISSPMGSEMSHTVFILINVTQLHNSPSPKNAIVETTGQL